MKDFKKNVIIILLLLLGLYLLRGPQGPSVTSRGHTNGQTQMSSQRMGWSAAEKSIDAHLKSGRLAEELKKDTVEVENELQVPVPNAQSLDPIVYTNEKEPIPMIIEGENPGERMYKENNPQDVAQRYNGLTPEQRINKKINRDEFARDYQKQQEEAFMQQYIENARRAGYELKLNAKGEVVDYREIGSSDPLRFPQSVEMPKPAPGASQDAKSPSGR